MLGLTLYFIVVSGVYETIGAPSVEHQSNDLQPVQRWASGVDEESIDRIVGGDEVDIKEYPYQVVLLFQGIQWCGGSIISDRYVLSAAHCFQWHGHIDKYYDAENFSVRVGSSLRNEGGKVYQAESFKVHENYDPFDFDICALKTAEKMELDGVTSAAVKLPAQGSSLSVGDIIVVTGWGNIKEGGPSYDVLRAVSVPVVALDKCKATYKGIEVVTNNMICAGFPEGGKDACQGDSGGPAVAADSGMLFGIVSFGHGCAREGFPGVYTKVANVRNWIKEATGV